ncbi:MAG TPA: nucleoside 2-deoxyribosyltransferase [Acidiphilium sp.]|nr:nucleoside 2-deoxyribosyltransferase [Acidiphilium sp.]
MTRRTRAYLAGPDLFLPDAHAHAARRIAIAARHGIEALAPLDAVPPERQPGEALWQAIFRQDVAMMERSDIVIAHLSPFRGASADAGTLVELGWFLGRGRPCFGYSNAALPFAARSRMQVAARPDPVAGTAIEDFGLGDNLMVIGALEGGLLTPPDGQDLPFDSLAMFERCVARAAAFLAGRSPPG